MIITNCRIAFDTNISNPQLIVQSFHPLDETTPSIEPSGSTCHLREKLNVACPRSGQQIETAELLRAISNK